MSALITIAFLVFLGLWASASYARLLRLRRLMRRRWREANRLRKWRDGLLKSTNESAELDGERQAAHRAFDEARYHYNDIAALYNKAIRTPPASLIASLAGFKHADLLGPAPDVEAGAVPPADR